MVAAEQRRRLLDAVNELSPDDRLVIGARYFLDLSEAEIAAMAGVPAAPSSHGSRGPALASRNGSAATEDWTDG